MGACFQNLTPGFSPFRLCSETTRQNCLGDSSCLSGDWGPIHRTLGEPFAGQAWAFMNCFQQFGRIVAAPSDLQYFPNETCGQAIERVGFPTFGACCHERWTLDTPTRKEMTCLPMSQQDCRQGWRAIRRSVPNFITGEFRVCWLKKMFIEPGDLLLDHGVIEGQDCDAFIDPLVPKGLTEYKGSSVVCRCTITTEPFMEQNWIDAGFRTCVRQAQDTRTWEEACSIDDPPDDLPCKTIGFPLVIDEDGVAGFYAGHKKLSTDDTSCRHAVADVYIDDVGIAHSIACVRFNADGSVGVVSIGDPSHDECVAMYADLRVDDDFDCN